MSKVEKKKEPGVVTLVLVLAVISLVMAFLLGLVNKVTYPAIQENTQKKIESAMQLVLPTENYIDMEYTGDDPLVTAVYEAEGEGYVIQVAPSGFSGAIDMMVGITSDGTVSGIEIIAHAETSGLGANAEKPEWRAQFVGATDDVNVTKDGGTIESITGSTITSRAVCVGVNAARAVAASME